MVWYLKNDVDFGGDSVYTEAIEQVNDKVFYAKIG